MRPLSNHRLCEHLLFLSLTVLAAYPFMDPDGWWHLRTGQYVLETNSIPQTDPFSGMAAGAEWVTHEWLIEVSMYQLYRVGGFGLLTVTFALVTASAFWIAYRMSDGKPFVAALATVLGAAAAAPVFGVRPQIISLLLVSVFLALLDPHETRGGTSKRLWWLVPLMLVWVNLHAAFSVGLGLIGLRIVGLLLDRWVLGVDSKPIGTDLRRLLAVLGACLLVVPFNPSGWKLYWYPFETMFRETERLFIQEWQSPDFHLPMFQAFAGVSLLCFVLIGLSGKRPRPGALLLLVTTFYASLQAGRHIPLFAMVAIPILAQQMTVMVSASGRLSRLLEPPPTMRPAQLWFNRSFLVLVTVFALAQVGTRIREQPETEARVFPHDAVRFLKENNVRGPIFNNYDWGGYLIWHLYPEAGPYVDGRPEIYGDPWVREFMGVYGAGVGWRDVLEGHDIRTVLVQPEAAISHILAEQPDWKKRFQDDVAVVFTRP